MTTQNLNLLLADDDMDDSIFFKEALKGADFKTTLTTVSDGEELMQYLTQNEIVFPDVIYLDLNMPRKNGYDCLSEIKNNPRLKHIPVIIYSTSFIKEIADKLYDNGADYYIRKPAEFQDLKKTILKSVDLIAAQKSGQPAKEEFIITVI